MTLARNKNISVPQISTCTFLFPFAVVAIASLLDAVHDLLQASKCHIARFLMRAITA
jgi:hypothetical protein